jgi:ribosomal protein L27
MAGTNVRVGKDHTLYAATGGKVSFTERRKTGFDGRTTRRKVVSVI